MAFLLAGSVGFAADADEIRSAAATALAMALPESASPSRPLASPAVSVREEPATSWRIPFGTRQMISNNN